MLDLSFTRSDSDTLQTDQNEFIRKDSFRFLVFDALEVSSTKRWGNDYLSPVRAISSTSAIERI